jgi:hypothetical protein
MHEFLLELLLASLVLASDFRHGQCDHGSSADSRTVVVMLHHVRYRHQEGVKQDFSL